MSLFYFFVVLLASSTVYCLMLSYTDIGRLWNEAPETRSVLTAIGVAATWAATTAYDREASLFLVTLSFVATGTPFLIRASFRFSRRIRRDELKSILIQGGGNDPQS